MNANHSAASFPADASHSDELNSQLTIRELAAEALEYHARVKAQRRSRTTAPRANAPRANAPRVDSLRVTLDQTSSRGVDWLWPGRIAVGRVTLLVGDPGLCKSLLALDVAARVTNGQPWPDAAPDLNAPAPSDSQPAPSHSPLAPHPSPLTGSVLLLCAEDDINDTIRPRLEVLGADLARIVAIPPDWSSVDLVGTCDTRVEAKASLRSFDARPLDLARDIAALEKVIVCQGNIRLVVIDPLSAYLGGYIDNFNGPVRQVFRQLSAMATRRGLAVLAISHLRKQSGSALHRTIGSLAFTAASRAAWLVTKDPADAARRLMLPMKNNLAECEGGLAFTIERPTIQNTALSSSPAVAWSSEPVSLGADDALDPAKPDKEPRPSPELDDAVRWLQNALAEGYQRSRKIEALAEAHGIRVTTLRRAFRQLGGEAVHTGFGMLGAWHWRLPGIGLQEPTELEDPLVEF